MKRILLLGFIVLFLVGCSNQHEIFSLEEKYYNSDRITEIDIDTFNELMDDKESFAIFIYQPLCVTSTNFENVLNKFLDEYQISFYKMSFSDMKETVLASDIRYYPSFAVIHEGELVGALDANSDEDITYYETVDGFVSWFSSYVNMN